MSGLNRSLGFVLLSFYGIGMILGAGIYSVIGKASGVAKESLWMSFCLAAVAAGLTAASYAELGTMYPKAGAEYTYLKKAFPRARIISIVCGLLMAFSGCATAATVALAFGGYLAEFVNLAPLLAAFGLISILSVVHLVGIKESSWVNVIFTLIELAGLGIFVYLGLKQPNFSEALSSDFTAGTLESAAIVIFAYLGFESIVTLAEESKKPERDVPRAIFLSVVVATVLYILVSLSAVALLSPEKLAASQAPLAAAAAVVSENWARILSGIALFATANTALISIIGTSRILYGIAEGRDLPKAVASVSRTRKSPWVAGLVCFFTVVLLLPIKDVEVLASLAAFSTMIAFCAINLGLIVLRYTEPEARRPFKVPLRLGRLPVLPVLGVGISTVLLLQFKTEVYQILLGLIGLMVLGYVVFNRKVFSRSV